MATAIDIADLSEAQIFSKQHGLAADSQLRRKGVSWKTTQVKLANGAWLRHRTGVIALAGAPRTWEQRAMGLVLACGPSAMIGGGAGARLHGLDGFVAWEPMALALRRGARSPQLGDLRVLWTKDLVLADLKLTLDRARAGKHSAIPD